MGRDMSVASLELSKELYGLSGWHLPDEPWFAWTDELDSFVAPKYTLGYLLRKLPKEFDDYFFDLSVTEDGWVVEYFTNDYTQERPISQYKFEADNPEDAVVKLAIELIKQKVAVL